MKKLLFCARSTIVVFCLAALLGILTGSASADETILVLTLTPNKDNYINRCSVSGSETNYGGAEKLLVRSFDGIGCSSEEPKSARTIIRFDLPNLKCPIAQATLGLYYCGKLGNIDPAGRTYEIRRLLNDWTEGTGTKPITAGGTTLGASWQNRHNFGAGMKFPWDSNDMPHIEDTPPCAQGCSGWEYLGGGDFPYNDCNGTNHWGGDKVWATAVIPADFGWMEWDVTALVRGWYSGAFSNNGLLIRDSEEQWHCPCLYPDDDKFGVWFYSKEYTDANYAPYLQVAYVLNATPDTCEKVWEYGLGIGSDFNRDCYVDFLDLAIITDDWLRCNDPNDPNCEVTW